MLNYNALFNSSKLIVNGIHSTLNRKPSKNLKVFSIPRETMMKWIPLEMFLKTQAPVNRPEPVSVRKSF
jgi:hypothetical protein